MLRSRMLPTLTGLLIAAVIATSLLASKTDQNESTSAAQRIADEILKPLAAGDITAMFAALRPRLEASEAEFAALENMLNGQRQIMASKCGKPIGQIELIKTHTAGQSFVRFTYVEKWERSALVWRLTFYRANDAWHLSDLAWDDKRQSLFE